MARIKMSSLADMPKREATYLTHNMQFPNGIGQIVLAIPGPPQQRLARRDAILRVFDIIDSHSLTYTLCAPHPDDPKVDARIVGEGVSWMYLSDAIAYEERQPTVTTTDAQGQQVMTGWATDPRAWRGGVDGE